MGNLTCITSAIDKSWKEKQKTWIKNGVNVLKPPSLFNEFRSWEDENTEAGRQSGRDFQSVYTTEKDEWICKRKKS